MVSINMKKMVPWRSSPVDLHGTIFGFHPIRRTSWNRFSAVVTRAVCWHESGETMRITISIYCDTVGMKYRTRGAALTCS